MVHEGAGELIGLAGLEVRIGDRIDEREGLVRCRHDVLALLICECRLDMRTLFVRDGAKMHAEGIARDCCLEAHELLAGVGRRGELFDRIDVVGECPLAVIRIGGSILRASEPDAGIAHDHRVVEGAVVSECRIVGIRALGMRVLGSRGIEDAIGIGHGDMPFSCRLGRDLEGDIGHPR